MTFSGLTFAKKTTEEATSVGDGFKERLTTVEEGGRGGGEMSSGTP